MKRIIFLLVLLSITTTNAKVWRVDKNTANNPDFTSLQEAHNAASAGDTIYIAGHGNSYGSLHINKQIVIIGTGYFLEQNLDKGVNPFESKLDLIVFKNGAENSIIMSCTVGYIEIQCNNIIIKRNKILGAGGNYAVYIYGDARSGIIVQQCFIKAGIKLNGDNFLITNNFILGSQNAYLGPSALLLSTSGSIRNNVISGYEDVYGAVLENNIFIDGISRITNCIERNNIVGEQNSLFTLTGNEDAKYILKDGSPAKGAGWRR
ncbi:MAG: hypothetical protein FD143_1659 [Ignavibacteria bacterium]|nr:MAG: hypothetical protein FD143_1659 [Ignavibacteria bacterium]